jgi:hypothetical protein
MGGGAAGALDALAGGAIAVDAGVAGAALGGGGP